MSVEYNETDEPELRDYLRILTRHKLLIFLVTVFIVGITIAYTAIQTPVYTASADVVLSPLSGVGLQGQSSSQNLTPTYISTQVQVFSSAEVKNLVSQKLHEKAPAISVSEIGVTAVLEVSASSTVPSDAAAIANAYTSSFVSLLQNQVSNAFAQSISGIQAQINKTQSQLASLDQQIASAPVKSQAALQAQLQPQINAAQQSLTVYGSELTDAQIQQQLGGQPAQVVTPANTPTSPSSPKRSQDAIVALIIGLLAGVSFALLAERLDDSVKSKETLEKVTKPLPVIGLIPYVDTWDDNKAHSALTLNSSSSPVAEAYRSLRTSIQFMSLDRSMRTIQITSSNKDEGKSTTVANLGVALAESGQKVIIVSCDLRLPKIHNFFNLSNEIGLTSVMLGEISLENALQKVNTARGELKVLASGPKPPNPSELLSSQRTIEIITELQVIADVVLIDSPPVLPVTDAAVLSRRVDATLVVAMSKKVTTRQLYRTVEILRQVNAPLIGTILNGAAPETGYGGSYSYTYGYGYYDTTPKHSSKKLQSSEGSNKKLFRQRS